jgi:RND family efflux transporter MFP subunit
MLLIILATGCSKEGSKDEIKVEGPKKIYAEVGMLEKEEFINKANFSAKLEPYEKVTLNAKVSGDLELMKKDIGDSVKVDETIAKIEEVNFSIAHKIAKSSVNSAVNGMKSSKISLDKAKIDFDRDRKLYEEEIISKDAFERSENSYELAKNNYATAVTGVESAKNNLRLADENWANAYIKSPIAGKISYKGASVGESLNPGMKVYEVIDDTKLYAVLGVTDKYINMLSEKSVVVCRFGNIAKAGKVTNINPVMNESNGTYEVKVLIDNEDGLLKSGMLVDVKINLEKPQMLYSVPKDIVLFEGESKYIFTVLKDRTVKRTDITVKYENGEKFGILEELEGINVIKKLDPKIKENVKVTFENEE